MFNTKKYDNKINLKNINVKYLYTYKIKITMNKKLCLEQWFSTNVLRSFKSEKFLNYFHPLLST